MAQKTTLGRRTFLAALGLGIAAPLAARMARRVEAAPTGDPVRLLNVYIPNGIPWDRANPVAYADPINPWAPGTIDLMNAGPDGVFASLAPWQEYFTIVRGLQIDGNADHGATNSVLTGGLDGGDSYDFKIAQELGVTPHVLGLSYMKSQGFGAFGHLAKHGGTWVRARENPVAAADEIFSTLGAGGAEDMSAQNEAAFRAELMDLTSEQIGRMQQEVAGLTSAENKLRIHLEALSTIREVAVPENISCDERPTLDLVAAADGLDHADINNWAATVDAHLQLAGYAMLCGAAPVLTLHALPTSTDFIMNFPGGPNVGGQYHLTSHGDRAGLAACQRWLIERIATVLMPILDLDDPSASVAGTKVIDNSIIYISSEVSDGDSHQSNSGIQYNTGGTGAPNLEFNGQNTYNSGNIYSPYPSVVLGGAGGCFNRGDIALTQSEATGGRPHADLLATIAHAMGTNVTDLGGDRSLIQELLA